MTVIGLTGNIGSGKTTVSRWLAEEMGFVCLNTDYIGKLVAEPGGEAYDELKECFGADYFLADGSLNRPKLAALVFNDKEELKKLNKITHPAIKRHIKREIERIAEQNPGQTVVIEAALLIEADYLDLLDELWLVWADDDVRLKRVMSRDSVTEEQAKSRMRNQMPQADKVKYAKRIVHNNGDEENLKSELLDIRRELLG